MSHLEWWRFGFSRFNNEFSMRSAGIGFAQQALEFAKGYVVKQPKSVDPQSEVIRLLLRYLIANPDAKDTAEGIFKWWIPKQHRELRPEELEKVLTSLVAKGWLIERAVSPREKLYALNREVIGEIERYLHERD